MRVLVIDSENLGLDFVLRCTAAGHEVRWYLEDKKLRDGEGFAGFKRIADWKASMPWARDGLILCTGNHKFLADLDRFRELGYKIFAPAAASAKLEIDRGFGMQAMIDAGIDVPPYKTFDSMAAAEKFAARADQAYVFKVLDGAAEDKALTYVSRDPADLVGWLRRNAAAGAKIKKCMLQEKIDADFEIGINGWFGPDGFLPEKYQISFEHKPLMPGDIGPNTGEMISVSQYVETDKLVTEMLTPLVGTLRKAGHRGDFCIGAMIDKAGKAWPLEATARCGFPAFFGQLASHKGDPAIWMRALLDGEDLLKISYDVCIAVVLAQPNWPYNLSPPELVEGNPISGADGVLDDLHLASVMKGPGPVMKGGKVVDGDTYQTTAEYVMVATALGKTIERARRKVYATIDQVHFPNMIYRNDAGHKVEKALAAMHKAGYALELH